MSHTVAVTIVVILQIYLVVGLVFALYCFFAGGLRRIDHKAGEASRGFKMLIAPGLVGLWPVLLRRALGGDGESPTERNAHRVASIEGPR